MVSRARTQSPTQSSSRNQRMRGGAQVSLVTVPFSAHVWHHLECNPLAIVPSCKPVLCKSPALTDGRRAVDAMLPRRPWLARIS